MFRTLREDKLVETAERQAQRVAERFPKSGLSQVAAEVAQVTREALVRAERIRQPDLPVRVGLGVLVAALIAALVWWLVSRPPQESVFERVLEFFDLTKGVAVYLTGLAIFLVTLEIRLKRRRALKAIHELRAIAHIIDMHQLTKSPDQLDSGQHAITVSGRVMTADDMVHYLNYASELLSLLSKVGQLYVQEFTDATALAAGDQFQNLVTGLSGKIWQKLMILDRVRGARPPAPPADPAPAPDAGANI